MRYGGVISPPPALFPPLGVVAPKKNSFCLHIFPHEFACKLNLLG